MTFLLFKYITGKYYSIKVMVLILDMVTQRTHGGIGIGHIHKVNNCTVIYFMVISEEKKSDF